MDDPLAALSSADVGCLLTIAAGMTLAWGRLLPQLKTDAAVRGIFSFELTWTASKARRIIESWNRRGMLGAARASVLLDVPWTVFYAAALAAAGVLSARAAEASTAVSVNAAGTTATLLTFAVVIVVVLDWLENLGLWLMLGGRRSYPVPAMTSLVSLAKWLLIGAVIIVLAALMMMTGWALAR